MDDNEEYANRKLAVLTWAVDANRYMTNAVDLSENGIVWSDVDTDELNTVLKEIAAKVKTLQKTIG